MIIKIKKDPKQKNGNHSVHMDPTRHDRDRLHTMNAKTTMKERVNVPGNFSELRQKALSTFELLGIPTIRHEEWKYTPVANIAAAALDVEGEAITGKLAKSDLEKFHLSENNAHLLIFENGLYRKDLSSAETDLEGVTVLSLAAATEHELIKKYIGKVASDQHESFVALNTAHFRDGAFVHIHEKTEIEKPVHILHVHTGDGPARLNNIRNLVVAGAGSKALVTESYYSLNDSQTAVTNSVTEVVVLKNAVLELVKVQLESINTSHIGFTQVSQERDSTFDTVTVTLGGKLTRNNLHILLNDVNCTSHLFGLYILKGEQLADNHTLVDHAKPNCFSNEFYKGILDDKSTGVFNGKIMVRQDAQKTNAYQSNKTILLSDDAQMNAKPQLEIFADDVKCTHGATTGQLDEEALFYLRSRGIGEQSARTLLNIAFAADVLNNIKSEELRDNLQGLAERKLMG